MPETYTCIKAGGSTAVNMQQEVIDGHNALRAMHSDTPNLVADEELSRHAQVSDNNTYTLG